MHDTHAAATTAARGLDDDRVADVPRQALVLVVVFAERPVGTRHARHAGIRGRSNKDETRRFAALGKIGVLRQEAVTRVYAHGVRNFRGADDRGHVQVAVYRGRGTDAHGFVGQQHVFEVVVGTGVHRDGLDIEFPACAQDTQRNLATIGYNDFIEHGIAARQSEARWSMTNNTWPYSTGSPFCTRIDLITPETSASIWFIIFMASMMHSVSPSLTRSPTWT